MRVVHMMIGAPGSGKTTFAKKLSQEKGYKIVSTDVVRQENPGISEENVWPTVYKQIGLSLVNNEEVIFDATNITTKVRDRLKTNIDNYCTDYKIKGYYFPTGAKTCISRVNKRNNLPGELFLPLDCIESYCDKIYPPTYNEGFLDTMVVSECPVLLKDLVFNSFQGYALYFKHGDQVIEEYSGFANINIPVSIKENTNFRLASVTKQFIAYGVLTLVEKGLLNLNDRLFDIFEKMPEYTKNISIHNLLCHTSGLYDYEDMPHTDKQVSDYEVLDYIRSTDNTYFPIGSKYQYSNTAYVLLGLIIEKVSNVKLGEYMEKEVFAKAGMVNTKVDYEGITEITPRAYGHILKNGKLEMKDQYWCSATIGDGGIYSSINDLKKWLKFIENIQEKPYSLMKEANYAQETNTEYGYGLRVKDFNGHKIIYHCGETIGTNTLIGYIKDLDIEFIFLTNYNGINTAKFIDNLKGVFK